MRVEGILSNQFAVINVIITTALYCLTMQEYRILAFLDNNLNNHLTQDITDALYFDNFTFIIMYEMRPKYVRICGCMLGYVGI